ncbi:MAG TPA: tetraacyldisaccharide 4'-kinase [Burkholderiaceae bacterium]|nr:tetraacyldisaccharide 4'-kinase [Burkholderiaceae bacterium]
MRELLERWLSALWWAPRRTAASFALQPLACAYGALSWLDRKRTRPRHPGLPVVVIGNLVVGGAGKTPTVIAVVRSLRALGWSPGVVSRGHGRREPRRVREVRADSAPDDVGDEPLLIHLRTRAPVVVGRDRVAAAAALRQAHPDVDLIVSDDGLQHHRLARDAEVIVFDERGVGNGALLPAGPLRERLPTHAQADALVLYNALAPSTPLRGWLAHRRLGGVVALDAWWRGEPADPAALAALGRRPVVAVAGIAHPGRFFEMLRAEGLVVVEHPLPDHHAFRTLPWRPDTPDVIVTEKDAVKLAPQRIGGETRVWVAPLDFQPDAGLFAALRRALPAPPSHPCVP